MRVSLIITTYNRPDALALVLRSAMQQTRPPDEMIVADDGSDAATAEVIKRVTEESTMPVNHAWQEDKGFRAARVRNLGASVSTGEYLIFIDGDMILHPRFVESHVRNARKGLFLHGKRAMLSDRTTRQVLRDRRIAISPATPGIGLRRYAFHSERLSRKASYESTGWYDTQSANLSLWREDFVAINGFNEDFEGWGREDSELAFRLMRRGLKKLEMRFCAVAFHLSHGKDSKKKYSEATGRNQQLLEAIVASGQASCQNGLSNHLQTA